MLEKLFNLDFSALVRECLQSAIFPWPNRLVIVRHAESLANYETSLIHEGVITGYTDRVIGQRDLDVPLTEKGEIQAQKTGEWLFNNLPAFDFHYRSPYRRTRQTSEIIDYRAQWHEDTRLREKEFGVFEQLTDAEVAEKFPELLALKKKLSKFYFRAPGGENYPDVILRLHSLLGTLKRDRCGDNVIVVCHQTVACCFRYLLEHWTEADLLRSQKEEPIKNASVIIYNEKKINGKSRLVLERPPFTPQSR